MPARFLAAALLIFSTAAASGQSVLISEVDADQTGGDAGEFVEVVSVDAAGAPIGNVALDGMVLVLFNGNGSVSYQAYDLDGLVTDAAGILVVIGNSAISGASITVPSNTVQNDEEAVAIYQGNAENFTNGTAATTASLVDAVVYRSGNDSPTSLQSDLGFFDSINDGEETSIARIPDGGDPIDPSRWQERDPSPGAPNVPQNEVSIFIEDGTIAESGAGSSTTATIQFDRLEPADTTVSIFNSDPTEVSVAAEVIVPANELFAQIAIDAVDDGWMDGDQSVTLTVSAPGFFASQGVISVQDDDTALDLVVNEIHAAVHTSGGLGDANRDGTSNSFDEFAEIVNVSNTPFDLNGFTLEDSATVRHTFPAGTILDPGCAVVVFGGGAVEGRPQDFGGALVQNGNGSVEFGLALNDSGDIVSIRNPSGIEVAGHVYGQLSFTDGSIARSPDLTGDFVTHPSINGVAFSPGLLNVLLDGFCPLESLTLEAMEFQVFEPDGSTEVTLTRSGPVSEALVVSLFVSDASELSVPATVTIPANEPSVTFPATVVDDNSADGVQAVRITASAPGFFDGTADLDVEDDGDAPAPVWINEIDADQASADTAEFVEIFDGGLGGTPLDGLVLVFFNGGNASDAVYRVVDLNGGVTNAGGFFTVGNAAVSGVDIVIPDSSIQNGPGDAVAVYRDSAANFIPGSTGPTTENLIDAVVYDGEDEALALALGITPSTGSFSEGIDTALARVPDGGTQRNSSNFVSQAPTPDASNVSDSGGFDGWAAGRGVTGGKLGDDDFDGILNLVEYGLGLNPLFPDAGRLPAVTREPDGTLTMVVPKGAEAADDTDIVHAIEVTSDLANWNPAPAESIFETADEIVYSSRSSSDVRMVRVVVTCL